MLMERLPWEVQSNILNVLAHQVASHYVNMHPKTLENIQYFLERYSKTKIAQVHSLFIASLLKSIISYFPSQNLDSILPKDQGTQCLPSL